MVKYICLITQAKLVISSKIYIFSTFSLDLVMMMSVEVFIGSLSWLQPSASHRRPDIKCLKTKLVSANSAAKCLQTKLVSAK